MASKNIKILSSSGTEFDAYLAVPVAVRSPLWLSHHTSRSHKLSPFCWYFPVTFPRHQLRSP